MWSAVKLGDVCEIQPKKAQVKKKLADTDTVSFMPMDDLGIDEMHPIANQTKTLAEAYSSYTYFEDNDVLLAKITPCFENGKLGIATNLANGVGFGSSEYIVLRCSEQVLPQYIYYHLNQPSFRAHGKAQMSGAVGHKRVPKDFVENLKIPLPPLAEQQRIVAKLDAAFAEIDRAIETCKEQISETVKLESHSLTSLFSSGEHILRRVNEIAEIKGGKRLPKGKKLTTENTGFPYIRVSDFNDNGSVDEESVLFVEPEVQTQISRYTISSDDVYVSIAGTIGKTGIVPPNLDKANLTENAAKLVFKDGVDRDFVYFFTRTSSFEKQAIAQTRQAAQPKLALERLGAVELPIYELPQQRQIAFDAKLLTEEIAKVIANREEKLTQLDALKSAILAQELQPPQSEAA